MGVLTNARHEKFAQCLFEGMSQRKAYREAFPNSVKWKDETVDSKACVLSKNEKVLERLNELQDALAKSRIMSAQERLEWLTGVVKDINKEKIPGVSEDGSVTITEIPATLKNKINAIDVMNKMQGEYVTKVEGSVNVKLEDLL